MILDVMLRDERPRCAPGIAPPVQRAGIDAHRFGEEPNRIVGLEMGADDYLPKAFDAETSGAPAGSASAVRWLPRNARRPRGRSVVVGDLWLDTETRTGALGEKPLMLTPVEFDLLLSLARAAGAICISRAIVLEVADRDFESFDRAIDVHISSLRRKRGDEARAPRIETVRGAGYRLRRPGTSADE